MGSVSRCPYRGTVNQDSPKHAVADTPPNSGSRKKLTCINRLAWSGKYAGGLSINQGAS
jgi:hypothetical protein